MLDLFTIGFTKKTARQFFERLRSAGVQTILDTRLNNSGQLAGFSKQNDLEYFADKLIGVKYKHWIEAAPTEEMLRMYKSGEISWPEYEKRYRDLIAHRQVEKSLFSQELKNACLLCSEHKPDHCHRRLLAEYLSTKLSDGVQIHHL